MNDLAPVDVAVASATNLMQPQPQQQQQQHERRRRQQYELFLLHNAVSQRFTKGQHLRSLTDGRQLVALLSFPECLVAMKST